MSSLLRPLRSLLPAVLLVPAAVAPGCMVDTTSAHGITLDDPLGLVADVAAAGNPLRLQVLPSSSYSCDSSLGEITPPIQDNATPGGVDDAVVDIVVAIGAGADSASTRVMVPAGDWTVLVRGHGTDPVSGVRNSLIASGCASVAGFSGVGEFSVPITLQPKHANGRCNDGTLSPDEQCDVPTAGVCDATCHTIPIRVNPNVMAGVQTGARAGTATGQAIVVTFDSTRSDVALRALSNDGATIGATGTSLAQDETLDMIGMPVGFTNPGVQLGGRPAVAADGHFAIAMVNYQTPSGDPSDVLVEFLSSPTATANPRTPTSAGVNVLTTTAGAQGAPDAAFSSGGALFAVYENGASATGLSATLFAAGAMTATMPGIVIGAGTTGGTHPAVAALGTGFVVAFSSATDVFYQRFGADGTAMDAAPVAVLAAADSADTQDQPSVAANSDGSFLVAWTEHSVANGDGMGTSIRARAYAANGMAAGPALVLPTTIAGDQSAPTVAAADGRYVVAWASAGAVNARVLSAMGTPLPNREQPQTSNDFVVAAAGNAPSAIAMGATPASWLIAYDDGDNVFARRYPR